eukprot:3802474-Rhodomonas_salina.1
MGSKFKIVKSATCPLRHRLIYNDDGAHGQFLEAADKHKDDDEAEGSAAEVLRPLSRLGLPKPGRQRAQTAMGWEPGPDGTSWTGGPTADGAAAARGVMGVWSGEGPMTYWIYGKGDYAGTDEGPSRASNALSRGIGRVDCRNRLAQASLSSDIVFSARWPSPRYFNLQDGRVVVQAPTHLLFHLVSNAPSNIIAELRC